MHQWTPSGALSLGRQIFSTVAQAVDSLAQVSRDLNRIRCDVEALLADQHEILEHLRIMTGERLGPL